MEECTKMPSQVPNSYFMSVRYYSVKVVKLGGSNAGSELFKYRCAVRR